MAARVGDHSDGRSRRQEPPAGELLDLVADIGGGRVLVRAADVDHGLGHDRMNALLGRHGKSHQPAGSTGASAETSASHDESRIRAVPVTDRSLGRVLADETARLASGRGVFRAPVAHDGSIVGAPAYILSMTGPDGTSVSSARRFEECVAMDQKLELLERVPLFASLGPEGLVEIGRISDEIDVPAGRALTHEGRHEGYFFIIVDGTVRIERGGRTINTIGAGDFLGEIALLDGGPRTATATTLSACRLLSMTHEKFHELLETSTPIRTAVLEAVGQRLRAIDAESVI